MCNCHAVPGGGDEKEAQMDGLRELDILWKPFRTETQKIQARFNAARELGFPHDVGQFGAVYENGFGELSNAEQDMAIYIYMATIFYLSSQSFTNFFLKYQIGLIDDQEQYNEIYQWLSIIGDKDCQYRSWLEYLGGWRAIDCEYPIEFLLSKYNVALPE
jgi:hypothetical protein